MEKDEDMNSAESGSDSERMSIVMNKDRNESSDDESAMRDVGNNEGEYNPANPMEVNSAPASPSGFDSLIRSPSSPVGSGGESPVENADDFGPASPIGSGQYSPAGSGPASPADSGPASPTGSGSPAYSTPESPMGSGPDSPAGSGLASPVESGPASPAGSGPASPAGSGPASPVESGPASPAGSGPASPVESGPASPAGSGPASPVESGPASPAGSGPASPVESGPASPAGSGPASPAASGPASPVGSGLASPAGSGPASPVGSGPASPVGSGPASPAGSGPANPVESGPASPAGSGPASPADSGADTPAVPAPVVDTGPASPADSESDHASPVGSPIVDDDGERDQSVQSAAEDADSVKEGAESDNEAGERADLGSEKDDGEASDKDLDSDADSEKAGSDNEDAGDQLIADIFGSSDEEDFEGFGEEDLETPAAQEKKKTKALVSDSDADDGLTEGLEAEQGEEAPADKAQSSDSDDDRGPKEDIVYDFDVMLQKKKEENRLHRRKKRDYDIINDNDDVIAAMLKDMKEAAEEDRVLNREKKPAVKKLKMLPIVLQHLNKADLQMPLLDAGVLTAIADWFMPLPDRSLCHLQIREGFLKVLESFPAVDQHLLKTSGVGRAVMLLYKHPRETKDNRFKAGKLINEWARPIFNLASNFKSMSREEREQRDYQQMPKRRKLVEAGGMTPARKDIDKALEGEDRAPRPGDPGFIARARVPMPSTRDYVVRPRWNVESEAMPIRKAEKSKNDLRLEKHKRTFREKKAMSRKNLRAVSISVEGRKMPL
ncbi:PREDICTED: protein IWS1 homolog [Priapulus caudatus]|uniref:Protein IWS1 homolog n=1 Tax=Priapulus caudatus TaxID=37621 RepID=A0ABM1EAZ5_PRICU|nr:PREDICTED: protein IWS1 homolog [Priapulus caudatus]